MTTLTGTVTRPSTGTGARARSLRKNGLVLGAVGLGIAGVSFLASLNAGSLAAGGAAPDQIAASAFLAFGLGTAGFATIKLGIGVILLGIVRRLWIRVDAVKTALPGLMAQRQPGDELSGDYDSAFGPASASHVAPGLLAIHRMAQRLWAPMLAMGAMLVTIGLLLDISAAGQTGSAGGASSAFAWAQGTMFLGETALLAGISLRLGTILAAIRTGGGEVQQSLDLTVKTLRMPSTAKAFIGLMVAGVMVGIVQFIGYAVVASWGDSADVASAFAALGPLREFGLGLLLAGIVLALATIAKALGFQFSRITEIISSGR